MTTMLGDAAGLLLAAVEWPVWATVLIIATLFLVLFFICLGIYAHRFVKVGPNQVLVISGKRSKYVDEDGRRLGFRFVKGGGSFIWPIVEKYDLLELELFTVELKDQEAYTVTGVLIRIDGVAQVKIKGDDESIRTAAERFLSMRLTEISEVARKTLEGALRAIVGTLTVEEIYKERDAFASKVQELAGGDMSNMGLSIDSFVLSDIRDNSGYLDALGQPRIAAVKRDAQIAQAEADRDATIARAAAEQAGQEAKFIADTKIAEAQRNYEVKREEYQTSVNTQAAIRMAAGELEQKKQAQRIKDEEVKISVVEKQRMIEVQDKEIQRRQRELEATIQKPADAEKYRIQALADAEKHRLIAEATGEAEAKKALGMGEGEARKAMGIGEGGAKEAMGKGEAAAERAKGLAEAEVIAAQGQATAEAMAKKADAWREYNQAAVIQMVIERLPELAAAIGAPLAKTDRITIVNTGGESLGASKITGDVAKIIAQLPPVIQSLSGVDLADLVSKLPKLGEKDSGAKGTAKK
jgi:flotillin